jgi:hypothetical protein
MVSSVDEQRSFVFMWRVSSQFSGRSALVSEEALPLQGRDRRRDGDGAIR